MNKPLIFTIAVLVFLFGCINQVYTHKINADGSSTLEQTTDLTGYFEYLKTAGGAGGLGGAQALDPSQLSTVCTLGKSALPEGTDCNVNGNKISLKRSFTPQDGFYTFEASGSKYKVEIKKIPIKAFSKPNTETSTGSAGGLNGLGSGQSEDIDFADKTKNLQTAVGFQTLKMDLSYAVEMPAGVTKATAGKYQAKIEGNRAIFNLTEILGDSAPLVVEAEAGSNMMLIVGVVVIVVVLALLWFFVLNKKPQQPAPPVA